MKCGAALTKYHGMEFNAMELNPIIQRSDDESRCSSYSSFLFLAGGCYATCSSDSYKELTMFSYIDLVNTSSADYVNTDDADNGKLLLIAWPIIMLIWTPEITQRTSMHNFFHYTAWILQTQFESSINMDPESWPSRAAHPIQ